MGNSENNTNDKHADNIKTINEFLIDLIGVLVPGGIFLFSIIIGVIIPIILIFFRNAAQLNASSKATQLDASLYATKLDLLASNVFQGWFWLVLFFMFLILSYAIGNIFYRLDIKDVDKSSFIRKRKELYKERIKHFIDERKSRFYTIKKQDVFLKEYFELLFYHLKEDKNYLNRDKQSWMDNFEKWRKEETDDNKIINTLNKIAYLLYKKRISEALDLVEKEVNISSLSKTQPVSENSTDNIVVKKLLIPFIKPNEDENNPKFLALGWYFLFCLRSEVACDNEDDCQFPYEHYDTYLLKRGEFNLVKHAKWCKDKDSRTKNAINTYKLQIQLKSKEVYNILVKNEAHIRMASSSYCVANLTRKIVLFAAIFIPLILLFPFGIIFSTEPIDSIKLMELLKYTIVICCMPVSIYFLNKFIRNSVLEFLHYQRLREIFFVIQVYDELVKNKVIKEETLNKRKT